MESFNWFYDEESAAILELLVNSLDTLRRLYAKVYRTDNSLDRWHDFLKTVCETQEQFAVTEENFASVARFYITYQFVNLCSKQTMNKERVVSPKEFVLTHIITTTVQKLRIKLRERNRTLTKPTENMGDDSHVQHRENSGAYEGQALLEHAEEQVRRQKVEEEMRRERAKKEAEDLELDVLLAQSREQLAHLPEESDGEPFEETLDLTGAFLSIWKTT